MDKPIESTVLPKPTPGNREEEYLYRIATGTGAMQSPVTNKDKYLEQIAKNGGTGGGGGSSIDDNNITDYTTWSSDKISKINTLNGQPQTNFDFEEDKVIDRGLILQRDFEKKSIDTLLKVERGKDFFVMYEVIFPTLEAVTSFYTHYANSSFDGYFDSIDTVVFNAVQARLNRKIFLNTKEMIMFYKNGDTINMVVADTHLKRTIKDGAYTNDTIKVGRYNVSNMSASLALFAYNRPLTPQEIQHNFQILNNSPSISNLTTTDSNGNKKEFDLSAKANQVVHADGKNAEQKYVGLLKTMAEEKVSVDGSDIQVANVVQDSQILSGSIEGRTVKQLFDFDYSRTEASRILVYNKKRIDNGGFYFHNSTNKNVLVIIHDANTDVWIEDRPISKNSSFLIPQGRYMKVVYGRFVDGWSESNIEELKNTFLITQNEGDRGVATSYIPFGLSSTQATISVNSNEYNFYEPTIAGTTEGLVPTDNTLPTLNDGDVLDLATRVITFKDGTKRTLTTSELEAYSVHKKVICLPFSEDKLTLNEDGSQTWVDGTNTIVFNGDENWTIDSSFGNVNLECIGFTISIPDRQRGTTNLMCDLFNVDSRIYTINGLEGLRGYSGSNTIAFSILRTKLASQNVDGFKAWLSQNNVTVIYQQDTPTPTHITKGVNDAISIQQNNIRLSAGEDVKPSSFKVTVPVNKVKTLEERIAALENVVVANTLK